MKTYTLYVKTDPTSEWVRQRGYDIHELDQAREDAETAYRSAVGTFAIVTLGEGMDAPVIHFDYEDISGQGYTPQKIHDDFVNILADPATRFIFEAMKAAQEGN